MVDKKKTCFVIMPISTHDSYLSNYRDDKDHFQHVLEHLFAPVIKAIDYELIPPSAKGTDVIHAAIIKNLEESDLVLCDMSTLNPNVFFELGIRTALNKPVCIVKDDKTPVIPFDMGITNTHTYLSGLDAWTLENDIKKLKEHIDESIKRSGSENMLWRQFGITSVAKEFKQEAGVDPRIEYVMIQLDSIKQQLEDQKVERHRKRGILPTDVSIHANDILREALLETIKNYINREKLDIISLKLLDDNLAIIVFATGKLTATQREELIKLADECGYKLYFEERNVTA
jgi:nucleoside 2-deoxyribosyltransferase